MYFDGASRAQRKKEKELRYMMWPGRNCVRFPRQLLPRIPSPSPMDALTICGTRVHHDRTQPSIDIITNLTIYDDFEIIVKQLSEEYSARKWS